MHRTELSTVPLTTAQRGLWAGGRIYAENTLMLAEALELLGPIDAQRLLLTTVRITQEMDALRLRIPQDCGIPHQVIDPDYRHPIPYIDLSDDPSPRTAAEHWVGEELRKPEDMENGPLWRCVLFRLGTDHHLWVQFMSHLAMDGYTVALVAQRLAMLYDAQTKGDTPPAMDYGSVNALPVLEQEYRACARYQRDRAYWKQQLDGVPPAPTLSSRLARTSAGLRRASGVLSASQVTQLHALGQQYHATLPQVLIALIATYYYRCTGAEDLVLAMPVTGRINAHYRCTPGMVANVVYLRLTMRPQAPLHTLFAQVASVVRHALRHQQYRFEDIRHDLHFFSAEHKIARLAVNIEAFDYDLRFGDARAIPHNLCNGPADDLTIFCYERGGNAAMRFDLDANPALYEAAELAEHCRRVAQLADAILADPHCALGLLDVLGHVELDRLLNHWNGKDAPLPAPACLPRALLQRQQTMPMAVVLRCQQRSVDYTQLCDRASRLAADWIAQGVRSGDVIAVALPRNEQLVIALLAVMWTGAAYLPLDPQAPLVHNRWLLGDSGAIALVCEPEWCEYGLVDGMLRLHPQPGAAARPIAPLATPNATACVLYTAGPTGEAKGVEVRHRGLFHLLCAMEHALMLQPCDRFLAANTVTSAMATVELYLPLLTGGCTVLATQTIASDPQEIAALITHAQVSVVQATPTLWRRLLADQTLALERVHALVGGETLDVRLAADLLDRAERVTQLYGTVETTIWSTTATLQPGQAACIGKPLRNTHVYVLDAQQQPLPTGAIGELYVGGAGVAKGYRRQSALGMHCFLPDPFGGQDDMLYRTGDRVRWREEGTLEFIGRAERRLTIGNCQLELGEIEQRLQQHPELAYALVCPYRGREGKMQLTAYVTGQSGGAPAAETLRSFLQLYLPEPMIPTLWVPLPVLPLTAAGKLDRAALPAPDRLPPRAHVAPCDALEHQVIALVEAVLEIENVGMQDNFFELGGDSLRAAELAERFSRATGMELPLGALLHAPTMIGLADAIRRNQIQADPLAVLLPLRKGAAQIPALFCIHPVIGVGWSFVSLLGHLDPNWPVYALQSPGLSDPMFRPESIEAIASRYVAELHAAQPAGPYRLAGWSLGGLIAHAMAAALRAAGECVELLAMLDTYPPKVPPATPPDFNDGRLALRALGLQLRHDEIAPVTVAEAMRFFCQRYNILSSSVSKQLLARQPDLFEHMSGLILHHLRLANRYRPPTLDVDLLFIKAAIKLELGAWLEQRPQAWQPYVRTLEIHAMAESDHLSMLAPQHAATLAGLLHAAIGGHGRTHARCAQANIA